MKSHSILAALAIVVAMAPSANAAIITIAPTVSNVGNCIPFGRASDNPYRGFIYQNIPAFDLTSGDTLAFDLAGLTPNDAPIEYDIEMAPTTVNGGSTAAGAFTKLVSNTQQALVPNGDTILGNYELEFVVESAFSFAGGGLIIRFSNPGVNFVGDGSCTQVLHNGSSIDASGYFVERFYSDADGLFPYDAGSTGTVGAFRVNTNGVAPVTYSVGGILTGLAGSVVLQNNGADDLNLNANGGFIFARRLANLSDYNVTILTQPALQTCSVTNGSGTIAAANIANVSVSCVDNPTVPPVTPTEPEPIPVMSVWGLGVLIGMLGLIGFRRRLK